MSEWSNELMHKLMNECLNKWMINVWVSDEWRMNDEMYEWKMNEWMNDEW